MVGEWGQLLDPSVGHLCQVSVGGGSDPVKSPSPENMGCGKAWRQPLPCYSSAPFAPCNPGHSCMWSVLLLSHFTE